MRVLIIVTDTHAYSLLDKKEGWLQDHENETWSMSVKQDLIVVVSQFRSQIKGEEAEIERKRLEEVRDKTTRRVIDVARKLVLGPHIAFLAFHSHYVNANLVRSQIEGLQFHAVVSFSHETNDSQEYVYPALCALVANPSASAFDGAVDAIIAKQGKTRADRVASIRHRILRLFVPTMVDFQGWRENDSSEEDLAEIMLSYRKAGKRLEQAKTFFYDCQPNIDNLEKVVRESGLAEHETWRQAKCLLPRVHPKSESERYEAELFCRAFDEEKSSETTKEQQTFKDNAKIESFKIWCAVLDETLGDLRDEILQKEK